MHTLTEKTRDDLSPKEIKDLLINGNKRFVEGNMADRNLLEQVKITAKGQFPHTVVLGCIDSRATSEQIFDQGIGDIFNTRIAGNVIDEDVLGSLEFSCKIAGAKLLLVLGHTHCGAVTAACNDVRIGHVTSLLNKIQPAVNKVRPKVKDITTTESINLVVEENINYSIFEIRERSAILKEMEKNGEIKILGGMYDIETGIVRFID